MHLRDRLRAQFMMRTAFLRLLPGFVIIGAQRSGTTTLYQLLSQHPRIGPATRKEVHYFDLFFGNGLRWYRAQFPLGVRRGRITGEASPYYLFHPHAPARIRQLLPEAKLIAILRDPVDRAYSHYHHNRREGLEPLSFAEAIEQEDTRVAGELGHMLDDPLYYSFAHQNYTYVRRGRYQEQLANYLRHFPRNQLLVLKSERFFRHTQDVWNTVLDFLELERCPVPDHREYNAGTYPDMPPAVREQLQRRFRPHNRRLAEVWGPEFQW